MKTSQLTGCWELISSENLKAFLNEIGNRLFKYV